MFDYSGYREVERDNQGSGTCDRFSELHLRLKLILFKRPLTTTESIKLISTTRSDASFNFSSLRDATRVRLYFYKCFM
ncbi:hypothetical protein [Nostoc sp. PA-18-2419]|uniref:hypothetical protein n=1 Tax=Nostoc sp. PA-18-2419 TaxID=2575443 RepID=UPI0011098534|nr:hypothetical protein [Nostoc sp. PA-18-2419]